MEALSQANLGVSLLKLTFQQPFSLFMTKYYYSQRNIENEIKENVRTTLRTGQDSDEDDALLLSGT